MIKRTLQVVEHIFKHAAVGQWRTRVKVSTFLEEKTDG